MEAIANTSNAYKQNLISGISNALVMFGRGKFAIVGITQKNTFTRMLPGVTVTILFPHNSWELSL